MTALHDKLAALRKLEEAATEGPWHIGHMNEYDNRADVDDAEGIIVAEDTHEYSFICHSRNNFKWLIDSLEKCVTTLEWYENHSWAFVYDGNRTDTAAMTFGHDKGDRARKTLEELENGRY